MTGLMKRLLNALRWQRQRPAVRQIELLVLDKVNVSATKTVIPDDLLAEMGRQHADDLKRAQQALPGLDLQQLWPTTSRWAQA